MRQFTFIHLALRVVVGVAAAAPVLTAALDGDTDSWIESSFEDFVDGQFGSSGANIYVSAEGTIQLINRWDLNQDGYIDLFFGNTHDVKHEEPVWLYYQKKGPAVPLESNGGYRIAAADLNGDGRVDLVVGNRDNNTSDWLDAYVYWGQDSGFSEDARIGLAARGITGIAIADLNGDDRPEVIFANEKSDVSFIYWNGPDGLSGHDRTDVATNRAKGITVSDLNQDGLPDLIFANGSNEAGGSFIYLGNGKDFVSSPDIVLETLDPIGVIAKDLNEDSYIDLVFANSHSNAYIYWGGSEPYSNARRTELPSGHPSDVASADLDEDGFLDLVFSSVTTGGRHHTVRPMRNIGDPNLDPASLIFWGSRDGFSGKRSTTVPTKAASSITPGDYDGDGRTDLLFTELRADESFDTKSLLYLNNSQSGLDFDHPIRFRTRGATDAVMADFDGDGKLDVAFANKMSGNPKGNIPAFVYLGGPDGFSTDRRLDLPSSGAVEGTFADFNDDGWTDVLVDNSDHDDVTLNFGARIFRGGPDGIDLNDAIRVDVEFPQASSTADFNRDGYLDILFSTLSTDRDALLVYWGGEYGFKRAERTELALIDGRATGVSDFNLDGYLDVIANSVLEKVTKIFWGSSEGFSRDRYQVLDDGWVPVGLEIADLNSDGYPDLVVCNFYDRSSRYGRVPSSIFWGGPAGFSNDKRTELATDAATDAAVVDLNDDGHLDIIFSNYRTANKRNPPAYIYWGGINGFDQRRRSLVPALGGAGMLAADLNGDNFMDLFFANHSTNDGSHQLDSVVLWGSAKGLHGAETTWLPGLGPHNSLTVDIGNQLTRKLEEEYISSVHRADDAFSKIQLFWDGETPHGTRLLFQIRTAQSRGELTSAPWIGPNGEGSYADAPGIIIEAIEEGQIWLQYRVILGTPDGGNSPLLSRVELKLR